MNKKVLLIAALLAVLVVAAQGAVRWDAIRDDRAGWHEMKAVFPQFTERSALARTASQGIRKMATDRLKDFKSSLADSSEPPPRPYMVDWKATVSVVNPGFISMLAVCDWYTGGAHGNRDYQGVTYMVVNNEVKRIKLKDLVVGDHDPVKLASELVIPKLREMGATSVQSGGIQELTEEQANNFVVTPAGITWLFAPYEMGSYAEGEYFVKVSWAEMGGRLSMDR